MDKEIHNISDNEPSFVSKFLKFEDSVNGQERQISYYKVEGSSRPGVLFIPGFMAHKDHKKSIEVLKYCHKNDIPCVSYDTAGYGKSTLEIKKNEARFFHWLQDAREVLLKLTDGPQVVIGSSMGAWLSMILCQEIKEKFCGLVLLAPAYNFGELVLENVISKLPLEIQAQMREGLVVEKVDPKFPEYGDVPLSYEFFEGLIPFNVPLEENEIKVDVPVRIIHGTKDEIRPTTRSEALISAFTGDDVTLLIIKGCRHELSDPKGLHAIFEALKELTNLAH